MCYTCGSDFHRIQASSQYTPPPARPPDLRQNEDNRRRSEITAGISIYKYSIHERILHIAPLKRYSGTVRNPWTVQKPWKPRKKHKQQQSREGNISTDDLRSPTDSGWRSFCANVCLSDGGRNVWCWAELGFPHVRLIRKSGTACTPTLGYLKWGGRRGGRLRWSVLH